MIYEISGIISTNRLDGHNDVVTKECIKDMSKQLSGVPLYLNHRRKFIYSVGKPVAMEICKEGLRVKFVLDNESSKFRPILSAICRGVLKGFSISFSIQESRMVKGKRHVNKIKLSEVSLVPKPANFDCIFDKGSVKELRKKEIKLLENL